MDKELAEIKKLLTDLDASVAALTKSVATIRRKMLWASVYGFLKFIVIIVPLVVGYFYLQPELAKLYKSWGQIMGTLNQLEEVQAANGSNQELLNQLQQLQQKYPQLR